MIVIRIPTRSARKCLLSFFSRCKLVAVTSELDILMTARAALSPRNVLIWDIYGKKLVRRSVNKETLLASPCIYSGYTYQISRRK